MLSHEQKKVSIITISYNEVEHIEQTLLSVINQDYDNIEYIVIDGGSTDGTVDIINKYRDRIAYFVSEKDSGIYNAMNKGLRHATGDIIGIINAGDWYEKNSVVSCAVNHLYDNDTDGVCAGFYFFNNDRRTGIFKGTNIEELSYTMCCSHESYFIKSELYRKFGPYDEAFRIAGDYDLLLKMYVGGARFLIADGIWGNFRTDGISFNNDKLRVEEHIKIIRKYMSFFPDKIQFLEDKIKMILYSSFEKKFFSETSSEFFELLKQYGFTTSSDNVIWGTGVWGQKIFDLFEKFNLKIDLFIDSNEKNHGKQFNGIEIKSPESLKDYNGNIFVAIANHDEELRESISSISPSLMERTYFLSEFKKQCADLYDEIYGE